MHCGSSGAATETAIGHDDDRECFNSATVNASSAAVPSAAATAMTTTAAASAPSATSVTAATATAAVGERINLPRRHERPCRAPRGRPPFYPGPDVCVRSCAARLYNNVYARTSKRDRLSRVYTAVFV